MTSRNMTSRLLAPAFSLLPVLVPALAIGSVAMASADVYAAEIKAAACKVTAFLATKEGDGAIPADLQFLEEQLRDESFAAFKGFRLLEGKTLKLGVDKPSTADLQSGFKLKLNLLGEEDKKLKLHANLMAAGRDKPLVDTAYKIDDNGLLLVGGVRHLDGKVFFAIHCRGEV